MGNTAITYNSSSNSYTLQTPAWIIEDGAYINLNGNDDYQIYNVTSGTIANALGLQSGDIPQTLNNIDITTMAGVIEAWLELAEETEFEFVISRGVNTVVLSYEVVYI